MLWSCLPPFLINSLIQFIKELYVNALELLVTFSNQNLEAIYLAGSNFLIELLRELCGNALELLASFLNTFPYRINKESVRKCSGAACLLFLSVS